MDDAWGEFRQQAEALLGPLLKRVAPEAPLTLETPPQDLADLAMPCFPLSKALRKAPAAIAQDLAAQLAPTLPSGLVLRAEAVGGYLNLHADRAAVARRTLAEIRRRGTDYGQGAPKERRVILEHTSANPNGPLHVGRARNPIIGDTLGRILRAAGWDVEVQYYVDDLGKQVATLAWGKANIDGSSLPPAPRDKRDHNLVRYYQAAHEKAQADPTTAAAIQSWVKRSEEADPEILALFEGAYAPVLEGMLASLDRIGVRFDAFVKESQFVANGDTESIIRQLNQTPLARQDDDGGRFLDLEEYGIAGRSQRFVYQRRDGTSLYATRDVAYHFWKAQRAARLVNVLGEDHKLQAQQVRIALELLKAPHVPEVVFYAFVSLPEGKMSTRRNRVVFLDDLIDEAVERALEEVTARRAADLDDSQRQAIAEAVGIGALRYNIVRVQPEKGITFKWEEALNFEGSSAPFVQYAYARCASILRKANGLPDEVDESRLEHPSEVGLMATLARLPQRIQEAADAARPNIIATYAQDVAGALSAFYRDCPVLQTEDAAVRALRVAMVDAARTVLGNTLQLLGVPVLETM
jgi:arginyl-tRNA synthetase